MYHYELDDTTTYDIPNPNIEILTIRYSSSRGVAIGISWAFSQRTIYVNSLHDSWSGWVEK